MHKIVNGQLVKVVEEFKPVVTTGKKADGQLVEWLRSEREKTDEKRQQYFEVLAKAKREFKKATNTEQCVQLFASAIVNCSLKKKSSKTAIELYNGQNKPYSKDDMTADVLLYIYENTDAWTITTEKSKVQTFVAGRTTGKIGKKKGKRIDAVAEVETLDFTMQFPKDGSEVENNGKIEQYCFIYELFRLIDRKMYGQTEERSNKTHKFNLVYLVLNDETGDLDKISYNDVVALSEYVELTDVMNSETFVEFWAWLEENTTGKMFGNYKEFIIARLGGYDYSEVAEKMGVSMSTVYTYQKRIKKLFYQWTYEQSKTKDDTRPFKAVAPVTPSKSDWNKYWKLYKPVHTVTVAPVAPVLDDAVRTVPSMQAVSIDIPYDNTGNICYFDTVKGKATLAITAIDDRMYEKEERIKDKLILVKHSKYNSYESMVDAINAYNDKTDRIYSVLGMQL